MVDANGYLGPSEAAKRLGISTKALRLYEQRGLINPARTAAGWRVYGPAEMVISAEIVSLRNLELGLKQIGKVVDGHPEILEATLADHQAKLENKVQRQSETVNRVRILRANLADEKELARLASPEVEAEIAFDLPWPWDGERFELEDVRPVNYIVGPLGCGKTRLARVIADTLPDAHFLGLDRLSVDGLAVDELLRGDPVLRARIARGLDRLCAEGASRSAALMEILAAFEAEGSAVLVIDMIEQGLDEPTQMVLMAYLRKARLRGRKLFVMTRSTAVLDLSKVDTDDRIILCPANHSPPVFVQPYPGAFGWETVKSCLAAPDVRARTEGVVAMRPEVA